MTAKRKIGLAAIFAILFFILIILVKNVDVAGVGAMGAEIGLSHINRAIHELFGVNFFWYNLTENFGYIALLTAAVFAVLGLCQLIYRRSLRMVDEELLILACLYIAVIVIYAFFEKVVVNCRPILMPGTEYPDASFPSSHTMLIVTVMGSAFILLEKYISFTPLRVILRFVCCAIIVLTVVGRLVCGVHWFTDIL